MNETLQSILINYIPSITVLLGFVGSCIAFLKTFYNLFKTSNIEEIKNQIRDENSALAKQHNELLDLAKQVMQENENLKELNKQLLTELTRIADYKEE